MTNEQLHKIIESKRAYRQSLAARPVAEKLAMLDLLRERTLEIHRARAKRTSERNEQINGTTSCDDARLSTITIEPLAK